jgi:hypothetical protein
MNAASQSGSTPAANSAARTSENARVSAVAAR